jgi:hypothetical protein
MIGEELRLATSAPHDLVMIDGTLTLPIIYFNQALNKAPDAKELRCSEEFLGHCVEYLRAYLTLLRSERSDKHYAALPKYSTRREIGTALGWPASHDDRGMLDREGNVTWHLNTGRLPAEIKKQANELADEIVSALLPMHVFYYKPQDWLPALRVEVGASVALNTHRLATSFHARAISYLPGGPHREGAGTRAPSVPTNHDAADLGEIRR